MNRASVPPVPGKRASRPHSLARSIAKLLLAAVCGVQGGPANAAELAMQVSARVLQHVRLSVDSQPRPIEVTAADIARGWVEVPAGMRITVVSNNPQGYGILFSNQSESFTRIRIQGLGTDFSMLAEGIATRPHGAPRGMHRDHVDLSFHFELSPMAREGSHPWPIQLSVMAL